MDLCPGRKVRLFGIVQTSPAALGPAPAPKPLRSER